jgi:hypothetical protein
MLKPNDFLGFQLPNFERIFFKLLDFYTLFKKVSKKIVKPWIILFSNFKYNQIWLNLPMIDHHLD